jgi:hypothetical protein
MKSFLLFSVLSLTFSFYSQISETTTLASGMLGSETWKIDKEITGSKKYVDFFYGFQNKEYTSIIDIGSVMFSDKINLEKFVSAIELLTTKNAGVNITVQFKGGKVYLYDFSENIYLEETSGKYTTFTKDEAILFVKEIRTKYNLLPK